MKSFWIILWFFAMAWSETDLNLAEESTIELTPVRKEKKKANPNIMTLKYQKAALKTWARELTDDDYNVTNWVTTLRKQPQNFFDYYVGKLSDTFKEKNAIVNFALVGACDGTNDNTIRDRYLPNSHWRGVFVEPIEMNYKDLNKFMESNGVANRTHLLHAAATSKCNSTTIKMKRPMHEEKNSSLPHW
jgi:hypothetical protein